MDNKNKNSVVSLSSSQEICSSSLDKVCHLSSDNSSSDEEGIASFASNKPSNPRKRFHCSTPKENSPLRGDLAIELRRLLSSPDFVKKKANAFSDALEKCKKEAMEHPRRKFSRLLMKGQETWLTKPHYDAMGFETAAEREEFVNKTSKVRSFGDRPSTPERYWDLDVPSTEECIKLGYVTISESPLFKTTKPLTLAQRKAAKMKLEMDDKSTTSSQKSSAKKKLSVGTN